MHDEVGICNLLMISNGMNACTNRARYKKESNEVVANRNVDDDVLKMK